MSNAFFPSSLTGYAWDCTKKPVFKNYTHKPVTGRDVRIALYDQPVFEFSLVNNWLTKADKDTLMGFFQARRGSFDSFLYADEDSAATAEVFATADGVKTQFQLTKSTSGFAAKVENPSGAVIYKNGVLATATVGETGIVTLTASAGQVLSWTGTAYYRCVFLEDELEYNQFANLLYDCNEIKFKGSLANKL